MAVINVRIDNELKQQAESLFDELGLTMSSAINVFLKQAVRENGMPFELKIHEPNDVTMKAIEEGNQMLLDKDSKGFDSMESFIDSLDK